MGAISGEKQAAYRIVRSQMERGELVRPVSCENCGTVPPPARDGRSKIQAHHHEGYDKPLAIQWLCAKCHMKVTPNLNTSNGNMVKTHCKRGHPFTDENMYRGGPAGIWRQCKECNRMLSAATYRRRNLKEPT